MAQISDSKKLRTQLNGGAKKKLHSTGKKNLHSGTRSFAMNIVKA